MFDGHDQTVCNIVSARRLVTPAGLEAARAAQKERGISLAAALLARGSLDLPALLAAVAEFLGIAYVADLPDPLPAAVVARVEAGLARTCGVVPVATEAGVLLLAAVDPFDLQLIPDLGFALGCEVRLVVGDPAGVARLIRRHYGEPAAGGPAEKEPAAAESPGSAVEPDDADLERLAGQTHIIRFVNLVLTQAIRDHASDIHFEPFERDFKIRYRIDGTLYEMAPPPKALALPVLSRLKVLANLNIAERRLPQDGRIKLTLGGRPVDLRISTLPTQFGESVVLRVLDQSSVRLGLGEIGLPAEVRAGVGQVIHRPNGIFLATGPTGSGKTTTLYSCLQELNRPDTKLLTVEDPVEYEIDGLVQVPVNLGAGLTFARALRTFLRQDPDIVMVGEIRDLETAQIAIQAALTGHLVLSTLHTNDAPGAITRLLDLGIAPFLLASTLEGVLAQRLVRRLCPACRIAVTPEPAQCSQLGLAAEALAGRPFFAGPGCAACHQTGYQGRRGLFEFLRLTEPLRALIMQRAPLMEIRQKALEEGMTSLRAAGVQAILAGDTTVDEVCQFT